MFSPSELPESEVFPYFPEASPANLEFVLADEAACSSANPALSFSSSFHSFFF
jgi:hypothetical protein